MAEFVKFSAGSPLVIFAEKELTWLVMPPNTVITAY